MKIAIIGAAGVRTPIIVRSIINRQEKLNLDVLMLMDNDKEHLDIIGSLIDQIVLAEQPGFKITQTTNAIESLTGADFVITTFRVGGIKQRMIDEKIAIQEGVLAQETTGPVGFAMAMRTIPVLVGYLELMKKVCPNAWLLNFANPSGLLAEVALRKAGWVRMIGICDGPASMQRTAAELLKVNTNDLYMEYFGLNHLGWIRSLVVDGIDILPKVIEILDQVRIEDLPFSNTLIRSLGMIPNEYLYFYYHSRQAVERIIKSGRTRGEQIYELNESFFNDMKNLKDSSNFIAMNERYIDYQRNRWQTYMSIETGKKKAIEFKNEDFQKLAEGGYSGVALDIIEALNGKGKKTLILNILNRGSIKGMADDAVVEIPVVVDSQTIKSKSIGNIPEHCVGLMNQVKSYERLTIDAALEGSYAKALLALTIHPLVQDENLARRLLDKLITANADMFPKLD